MIARLFNAPIGETETAIGVGTVGSSEAIMLAGLAFKRRWQTKRKSEGKPYDKPNIVTGANVQVNFTLWLISTLGCYNIINAAYVHLIIWCEVHCSC
jgi:hypothetical protein